MVFVVATRLHPFLAVSEPVESDVLVVEGWLPDYALEQVASEFRRKSYRKIYLTGGPLDKGFHLAEYKTHPALAAATLLRLGLAADAIEVVAAPRVNKDRTYASAVALKERFREHGESPKAFQIVSLGSHARRSRLLFNKAFGEDVALGITALAEEGYDPTRWWSSSEGVRSVIAETIAYGYARLLFRVPKEERSSTGT